MKTWKFDDHAIQIRGLEHGRPHVHVITPDHVASMSIADGEVIAGAVPSKIEKKARKWVAGNEKELMDWWAKSTAARAK